MVKDPEEFMGVVAPFVKPNSKYFLRHRGALKTMPRGFQEHADSPVADYIKWKHFLIGLKINDRQAQSRKLVELVGELANIALPFLSYGWSILETAYEDDPRKHMRKKE